jgi:hypothetical protein
MRATNPENGNKMFTIDFMSWDDFLNGMLNYQDRKETWVRLSNADCLIGGVDTSISYL